MTTTSTSRGLVDLELGNGSAYCVAKMLHMGGRRLQPPRRSGPRGSYAMGPLNESSAGREEKGRLGRLKGRVLGGWKRASRLKRL